MAPPIRRPRTRPAPGASSSVYSLPPDGRGVGSQGVWTLPAGRAGGSRGPGPSAKLVYSAGSHRAAGSRLGGVIARWIRLLGSACSLGPTSKHGAMSSSSILPSLQLSAIEARIVGCLIEKEATTADVYPLTLNALVNACNQRNNRAPVMALSAREVEAALEPLRLKRLVVLFSGADARVPKFRHTLDTALPMEPVALALMAELLLRGSQTLGELRGRAERLRHARGCRSRSGADGSG